MLKLDGNKTRSPSGLDSRFFVCLIYINDLPTLSKKNTQTSLYAGDTSIIVTSPNPYNYQIIIKIFFNINNWFKADLLPLNLGGGGARWLQ
jgi:hypothetical protein